MRHPFRLLLAALTAVLVSIPANAVTIATLKVNNTVRTLTGTGFLTAEGVTRINLMLTLMAG